MFQARKQSPTLWIAHLNCRRVSPELEAFQKDASSSADSQDLDQWWQRSQRTVWMLDDSMRRCPYQSRALLRSPSPDLGSECIKKQLQSLFWLESRACIHFCLSNTYPTLLRETGFFYVFVHFFFNSIAKILLTEGRDDERKRWIA